MAEKKLNDNQTGAPKRCSGAVLMPSRLGGSQTLMSRMVPDRVSIQIYTEREFQLSIVKRIPKDIIKLTQNETIATFKGLGL